MRFESEITAPVTVEIVDAIRAIPGCYGHAPGRCYPSEPGSVDLLVTLGGVDITAGLSAALLEALTSEALERLEESRLLRNILKD